METFPKEKIDSILKYLEKKHPPNSDPWGLDVRKTIKTLKYFWPIYKDYFKVRIFGGENVEDRPYMVVANHSGQVAIDALLISLGFILDLEPPRILRPMVERFVTKIPFFNLWASEGGSVLGDRENCLRLLDRGESTLVFPEGVRGITKNTSDYYRLKKFTKGFFRLAQKSQVEILPIAVIGAEEFYPLVYHSRPLAKLLGLPAFPLTPGLLLGPLGLLPLPSPVDIYIGKPYKIPQDLSLDASDKTVQVHVDLIVDQINKMIDTGLKNRRPFFGNIDLEK